MSKSDTSAELFFKLTNVVILYELMWVQKCSICRGMSISAPTGTSVFPEICSA